jgi:hypothetical protein
MTINILLPSLFFAFVFHWCLSIWKQPSATWYPQVQGLWAGFYATLTISASFGMVGLFTHSLGVCGNPGWGEIGQNLLCNLDGYGFESKSWFGAWFIIAAYCYQTKGSIESLAVRIFQHRDRSSSQFSFIETQVTDRSDFSSIATINGDMSAHDDFRGDASEPTTTDPED